MEDKDIALNEPVSEVSDKTFNNIQVNDIVKREKARAVERARLEMEAKHKEELDRLRGESAGQPPIQNGVNTEEIERNVFNKFINELQHHREEAEKEAHQREAEKIAEQYFLKMGKGSEMFEDFNEVMGSFKPESFSNVVKLTAGMENTPEIMYELAKNPSKLLEIDQLANRAPEMAMKQLERLAGSINQNLEAKKSNVSAPAPLSRLKSSSVGADNGKMSLKDYKSASWLRG